ncbi:uncharacterized protein LOC124775717 [Schistocerca piceifrons]|uniref:uncharacterized protein LOC124775717 n=2 Tax=Schistocerca TaxID=7008 RepID=UPI001F5F704B|nr:uncharacterized protein LOC124775717 [Schistocerca piceifrons]
MTETTLDTTPEWLDRDFVATCLSKDDEAAGLRVKSFVATPLNTAAQVAGSRVMRVAAELEAPDGSPSRPRRLVLKTPAVGMSAQLQQTFRREVFVYSRALPDAEAALRAAEGESFRPVAARCLLSGDALALEDLSAAGFRLAAGGASLDLPHCALVARAVARLHAASAPLVDREPYVGELFRDSAFFNEASRPDMQHFTEKNMLAVAEALDAVPGFAGYAQKYRQLAVKIFDRLLALHRDQEGRMRVLLHGDLWRNNLMFRYSDGRPVDVRLVDFQMAYVGSPAQDLQFFLYGNASEEVHRNSMEYLLSEYHCVLQSTLSAMGEHERAASYPLEQLRRDMDDHALLGLYCACNAMGFTLAPSGSANAIATNATNSPAVHRRVFTNPALLSYIKHVTPIFESKGLL